MHKWFYAKIALAITGSLLFLFGIMVIIVLPGLSDPEIEGESARIGLGVYAIALIPVIIGILFIITSLKIKKKTSD
jgi:hypothetical protein